AEREVEIAATAKHGCEGSSSREREKFSRWKQVYPTAVCEDNATAAAERARHRDCGRTGNRTGYQERALRYSRAPSVRVGPTDDQRPRSHFCESECAIYGPIQNE